MYPRLVINLPKLTHNINTIHSMCLKNNIPFVTLVVKALAGNMTVISEIEKTKPTYLGDSRIQNLKKMANLPTQKMLLRIPNNVELNDVIRYADCSLESEIKIIRKLNNIAIKKRKIHSIMLMFDMGDLREGIFFESDYMDIVKEITTLSNIYLEGIGTNLTCFGGVLPTSENLSKLTHIASKIETVIDRKLSLISGGNSSSLTLFDQSIIPQEVNHLRIGEGFLLGKETSYGTQLEDTFDDAFILEAKIIECKNKPSFPIGKIGLNSFGEVPIIKDQGMMKRAILGVGKQDVILDNLTPIDSNIKIIGGSSDHLIIDVTNTKYRLNDVIKFKLSYPAIVHLMNSSYIHKKVIK
ncbi:MAG: alanine/ornithine racemase family PLP-dependent enzyme [Bacilli bacterium]|nr:alanine/ornithine racemase family PLP-dependent enzyme [Bacilli bacterium]